MADNQNQPTRASEFILKIDREVIKFMQVSGLERAVELHEIKGGSVSCGARLVRDRQRPGRLQLSKGSGKMGPIFEKWIQDSLDLEKPLVRRNVEITVLSPDRTESRLVFTLLKAFPFSWSGPVLSTETDQAVVDQLSMAYEGIRQGSVKSEKENISFPQIKAKDDSASVLFRCQPHSLSISQEGEYGFLAGPGMARPRPDYKHGKQRVLRTQLTIDWDLGGDEMKDANRVYEQTDILQGFLKPKEDLREPPLVVFQYGEREFEGYLTGLDISVEKFTSQGLPLRVNYQITMVEGFEAKPAEDKSVF